MPGTGDGAEMLGTGDGGQRRRQAQVTGTEATPGTGDGGQRQRQAQVTGGRDARHR